MKKKVQVWIYCKEEVLLLKTNEQRGGFWQPVTGSVEENENLEASALREAQEETGLHFSEAPQDLHYEFKYEKDGQSFHEACFALSLSPKEKEAQYPQLSPEHQDHQWLHYKKAASLLRFDSNRQGLLKLFPSPRNS